MESKSFTFTFPLPFKMLVPHGMLYDLPLSADFCGCADSDSVPHVRAIFLDRARSLSTLNPPDLASWVEPFSGKPPGGEGISLDGDFESTRVWLETLALPLASEDHECGSGQVDPFTASVRCRTALNEIITAYGNSHFDAEVFEIDARDIGYLVLHGERNADGSWQSTGQELYNLELWNRGLPVRINYENYPILLGRLDDARKGHPFLNTRTFRRRAHYLRFDRGDQSGAVLALAMAAESLLFDLRMMLELDSSGSFQSVIDDEVPFTSLIKRRLPHLLGGDWQGEVVENFWNDAYRLRNRVIHGGYTPRESETLAAMEAFDGFQDFIVERLKANWRKYPRTLVCLGSMQVTVDGPDGPRLEEAKRLLISEGEYWLDAESKARIASSRFGGGWGILSDTFRCPPLHLLRD